MVNTVSMPALLKLIFILFFVHSSAASFNNSKPEPIERKLAFEEVKVFVRIDCGGASDNSIDSGVKRNISSEFTKPNEQGQTLRSFPEGTRNCYRLKPDGGAINNKYLVRASFLYGNYDGFNKTPIFDLHIGVNKWTTVNLTDSTDYKYYEIIYVSSAEYADVCLVNTSTGVPFISSLELRVLDDSMYQIDAGSSLLLETRYDVGTLSSARATLPKDDYGRNWNPQLASFDSDWIPYSMDESIQPQSDLNPNKVPEQVWKTAAHSQNSTLPLYYRHPFGDPLELYHCHFYLYFAEIIPDTPPRKMAISLNSDPLTTSLTLPESPATLTIGPLKADAIKTIDFEIKSLVSDAEPILNALELFILNELPNRPTETKDVDAMMEIKKAFNLTRNWQGDPCVPSNLSWAGVGCRGGNPPRIISLNLSSSNLVGELPPSLSKLTAIESLDLSRNNLTGSVPSELKNRFKDRLEMLRLDGNNKLCMSDECNTKKNMFVIPIVIAVVAFCILASILILAMFLRQKRDSLTSRDHKSITRSLESKDRVFSYSKIVSITCNFKTVIGEGGFGKVYHGVLADQTQVAVKMLSRSSTQGSKEFRAEAQLLTIVHHKNLVSLVGYCDEDEHLGLVYEYMANGNLQQHLSETKENVNIISWRERLQIAVTAAQGLEYLHNGCKPPIIHRDLKPANILLDEKMQAKISDFGVSRAFSSEFSSFLETNPAGTLGYFDPEYQASGNMNKKSDVYSFGIILLELITGQRAIIKGSENNTHIVHWVKPILERGDIRAIVDLRLHGEFQNNAAWKALEVAMSCVEPTAIQRPGMSQVLMELKDALELEMQLGRTLSVERKKMTPPTDYSILLESVEVSENMTPQAR